MERTIFVKKDYFYGLTSVLSFYAMTQPVIGDEALYKLITFSCILKAVNKRVVDDVVVIVPCIVVCVFVSVNKNVEVSKCKNKYKLCESLSYCTITDQGVFFVDWFKGA